MADVKISELDEADLPLDGTEDMVIVQDGVTKRCSTQDAADLATGIITVKVSLSSAEILALNTTPKTIVAAPGAGKVIRPISQVVRLNYGSVAYSGNSMNTSIFGFTIFSQTAYQSSSNAFDMREPSSVGTNSDISNKALVITVSGANPTLGDSAIDVYLSYLIITL